LGNSKGISKIYLPIDNKTVSDSKTVSDLKQ